MLSRAARVKVWEERIEEEEEELEQELMESLRLQEQAASSIKGGKVKGSISRQMHLQTRAQQAVVGGGSKTKTSSEEIGVFDAERYFGGAEQPAGSWAREEEDELMEGEAGGDLPLSPLVELGKGQLWRWRSDGVGAPPDRRGVVQWAATMAAGSSLGRRRVESSEFTSPRTSTASSLSEVEPPPQQRSSGHPLLKPTYSANGAISAGGKPVKTKVQPASPSGRLANFLAKFKAPTPRKSAMPCSPITQPATSASTPPPLPPPRRAPATSVLSPAKKLFPQYSLGLYPAAAQAKTSSSPRGRFLRAFSSSSADNAASALSLRYHHSNNSAINATPSMPAASSPVSPAARSAPDPYSPVAHSASTTPTSSRLPRSSAHINSNFSHHHGSKSNSTSAARSKTADSEQPGHCNSSSSFKQQLPFLGRKLKVYLMPDKAALSGKQDKSSAGKTAVQGHEFGVPRHQRHPQEGQGKQRRRWLHADDQVVDEDIELAERLLRVVQDHQSIGLSQHSKFSLLNQQAVNGSHINKSMAASSNNIKSLYVDRVSEYSTRKYDQMHPATISPATSNLVPHAAAAHANGAVNKSRAGAAAGLHLQSFMSNPDLQLPAAAKDQEASGQQQLLYDSDSSSDLFEIETLASSVGMGLYARRDLPVYEAKEGPFPNHSFSFASTARPTR